MPRTKQAELPRFIRFLKSPKTAILGIIIGFFIGFYFKTAANYLAPFGESYVGLLSMCTFPITAASIMLGLAKTIRNSITHRRFVLLVGLFFLTMFLTFSVCAGFSFLTRHYVLTASATHSMTAQMPLAIETYEKPDATSIAVIHLENKSSPQAAEKLAFILQKITPRNIFSALNEGMTLKVIFLILLIGVALGKSKSKQAEALIDFIDSANRAFQHIFHWILYLLPLGLACIFASNTAAFSGQIFVSLTKITLVIGLAGISIFLIYYFLLCYVLKMPLIKPFQVLRQPYLLALTTMSSTVAIPSSLEALRKFKLRESIIDLLTPLGISINRQGNMILLVMIAIVTAAFYQVPLGPEKLFILFLGAGLMGGSTFGTGTVLISTYITICTLMGLPSTAGVALLTLTDLFLFWICLWVTLQVNYLLTAILGKPEN